jgi:hypothetical protein
MTEKHGTIGGAHHEPDRTNVPGIAIAAAILAVGVAITVGIIHRFERTLVPPPDPAIATPVPRTPADETVRFAHWEDPIPDLAAVRQREADRLNTYRWLDRETGIVRIPIERAMELTVQRIAEE